VRARKGGHAVGAARAEQLIRLAKASIASATAQHEAEAMIHLCDCLQFNRKRIAKIEGQLKAYAQSDTATESAPVMSSEAPASIPRQIRLLDTFPGIALTGASTLVLRCRGLERFTSAKALAAQLGTCPDRIQTGSSKDRGQLTYRGDRRTRSTLYLMTQIACQGDPALAFHKWRHKQKGHTPKQAICACMNRYARILWAAVRNGTAYDPVRAMTNARIHHPELWKTFVQNVLPHLKNMTARKKNAAQAA
jgi:transposase